MQWIPYAMVRVSLLFIGGILLSIYQPDVFSIQTAEIFTVCLAISFFGGYFVFHRHQKALGVVGLLLIFFAGYLHLQLQTDSRKPGHLLLVNDTIQYYSGIVRSYPESKARSWKLDLEVNRVFTGQWQPAAGRVQVYVAKKDVAANWRYGDELLVRGRPRVVKPPANPGEFDFKRFLTFKNIYHQHFLRAGDFKIAKRNSRPGLIYYAHRARAWASHQIETFISGEQEQAIAMALILGVTDGIDTDLVNAYSASGAMHVLAVSGLHVGIIYALLLFALKPLARYAWSRWLIAGVSILCLWTFAFVTGLSPSVLRAVTMFSFMAAARPFGVRTNIYNTLAASAFALLLYNPYLIMSVGFQLSYLAVLGIVYLQRPIYHLLQFDTWLGNWIWQITCISIAAQLATFSLGLLYFHQFPVYFLASNLFVIPLSTFILVGGIILLMVQVLAPVAVFVGTVLHYLIWFLNWVVFQTEQLPFSLINNVELTTFQSWLLMAILVALIFLFELRTMVWLWTAVIITCIFSFTQWLHFDAFVKRAQLVVYRVQGHRAIDLISNGRATFVSDSILSGDQERIRFHIRPNRLQSGIFQVAASPQWKTVKGVTYLMWRGKVIAMPEQPDFRLPISAKIDYLIISNNIQPHGAQPPTLLIDQIVLDGSNAPWVSKRWQQWGDQKIARHDVATLNCFVVNL